MEQMKARDYGLMKISLMEVDYLAKMASCNMDAEINLKDYPEHGLPDT